MDMRFRRRDDSGARDGTPAVRERTAYEDNAVVRDERTVERPAVDAAASRPVYEERVTSESPGAAGGPVYNERTTRTTRGEPIAPPASEDRAAAPVYEESVMTDRRVGYLDSLPVRVNAVLLAVLAIVEGLIGLRFALLATGASATSGFVEFIYDVSWPLVRPFSNAFTNRTTDSGIIEVSSLLAIGVWLLVFLLVTLLINALLPRSDDRSASVRRERMTHS